MAGPIVTPMGRGELLGAVEGGAGWRPVWPAPFHRSCGPIVSRRCRARELWVPLVRRSPDQNVEVDDFLGRTKSCKRGFTAHHNLVDVCWKPCRPSMGPGLSNRAAASGTTEEGNLDRAPSRVLAEWPTGGFHGAQRVPGMGDASGETGSNPTGRATCRGSEGQGLKGR